MKFILYHPTAFESWDYRNVDIGIGGSETHQIEMSWRLAQRGHEVVSYAPIPDDCVREHREVQWRHLDEVDFSEDGLWIVYRAPHVGPELQGQRAWLLCQDWDYPTMTEDNVATFEWILPLCQEHHDYLLDRYSFLKDRMWITSNGLRFDVIRELEAQQRNPQRIMYASSPDRGLLYTIQTFLKAREFVPDAELHVFYGWNNIDKIGEQNPRDHRFLLKQELEPYFEREGITWHGRVPQRELYKEWLKSGIWLYQTNFLESSCVTCMEAQALGAIPITNPIGALSQNVMGGILVAGDAYNDRLVKGRYLGELIRLLSDVGLQEKIRRPMAEAAIFRFNWERMVDQWERVIYDIQPDAIKEHHLFQRIHADGKILNVGCDMDFARFGEIGAVNVDCIDTNPRHGYPMKAHVIADVRNLPFEAEFDSVVLGEVLEHMSHKDGVLALQNCKQAAKDTGKVIVTCPVDDRNEPGDDVLYADGCTCNHRHVTHEELLTMVDEAGLNVDFMQEIDCTYLKDWGLVCSTAKEY